MIKSSSNNYYGRNTHINLKVVISLHQMITTQCKVEKENMKYNTIFFSTEVPQHKSVDLFHSFISWMKVFTKYSEEKKWLATYLLFKRK